MTDAPSADWERSCISLLLHDKESRAEIFDAVLPLWIGDRPDSINRRAFAWLGECWRASFPIDSESVKEKFAPGGPFDSCDNIDLSCEPHDVIRMLRDQWTVRSAREWVSKMGIVTDGGSADQIQTEVEKFGHFLSQNTATSHSVPLSDAVNQMLEDARERRASKAAGSMLTWGLDELDRICQIESARLYVVAARPAIGKTALGFTVAKHQSTICPVGYISGEMTNAQMAVRATLSDLGEPARVVRNLEHGVEQKIVNNKESWAKKYNMFLNCGRDLSIHQLPAMATDMVKNKGCKILYFDYLQDIRGDRRNGEKRNEQVASMVRIIKGLAKTLGIPIVLLAQLSRESAGTQPKLEHLSESSAIEMAADVVLLLDRPEMEAATQGRKRNWIINGETIDSDGKMAVIQAKARDDAACPIVLGFNGRTMTPYTLNQKGGSNDSF